MKTARLMLCLALTGCSKCDRSHPYVPYKMDDGDGATIDASAEQASDAGSRIYKVGISSPPNVSQLTLDGITISAPPERTFVSAFTAQIDDVPGLDAIALVGAEGTTKLDLVFYSGGGAPKSTFPIFMAKGDVRHLHQIGRRDVLVDVPINSALTDHTHQYQVVRVENGVLRLKLGWTAWYSEQVRVSAESDDIDHDGTDDIRIAVDEGDLRVETRYYDRPQGMSRDLGEPTASIAALVERIRKSPAKEVANAARRASNLILSACQVGLEDRNKPFCSKQSGLEDLYLIEARASAQTDPLRAIHALTQISTDLSTRTPKKIEEIVRLIQAAVPTIAEGSTQEIDVPLQRRLVIGKAQVLPAYSRLSFNERGELLILSDGAVVRFDPTNRTTGRAADVAPWIPNVQAPDLTRAVRGFGCTHLELSLDTTSAVADIELKTALDASVRCPPRAATFAPVAWTPEGLLFLGDGSPLRMKDDKIEHLQTFPKGNSPFGSARSPHGDAWVTPFSISVGTKEFPTYDGFFVMSERGPRIFRSKEITKIYAQPYATLQECVVADSGVRVACVQNESTLGGHTALFGEWKLP